MFNFYSLVEDFEQYDKINERALKYRDNIRDVDSIKDIVIQNLMILDQRNQENY